MAGEDGTGELPETRLRDLAKAPPPVHVVGRIVLLRRREVTRRSDGGRLALLSGILSDGTAGVRFSWWDPPREGIERGAIVRIVGAETRTFRGKPELVISWKTRIGPAGPAELPKLDPEEIPLRALADLTLDDEGFRIEARVVRADARSVTVGEESRVVHDGLLADRSGVMAFTAWSDFGLAAGEAVRISGAYVREFRRRRSVVLDERSMVERFDGADLPQPAEILAGRPRSIADVEDEGGGEAVAIEGVVVGLLPPSGLVYRCRTCRRIVQGGICRVHGQVDPMPDLRARLVVDDGTGGATVSTGRKFTEMLWGVTLPEVLERLKLLPDRSVLEQQLLETVVGRRLRVRGAVVKDDFGLTVDPESVEPVDVDLDSSARELAARLEAP
jgi:replication factor A1